MEHFSGSQQAVQPSSLSSQLAAALSVLDSINKDSVFSSQYNEDQQRLDAASRLANGQVGRRAGPSRKTVPPSSTLVSSSISRKTVPVKPSVPSVPSPSRAPNATSATARVRPRSDGGGAALHHRVKIAENLLKRMHDKNVSLVEDINALRSVAHSNGGTIAPPTSNSEHLSEKIVFLEQRVRELEAEVEAKGKKETDTAPSLPIKTSPPLPLGRTAGALHDTLVARVESLQHDNCILAQKWTASFASCSTSQINANVQEFFDIVTRQLVEMAATHRVLREREQQRLLDIERDLMYRTSALQTLRDEVKRAAPYLVQNSS